MSLYLDIVRICGAFVIFLSHASAQKWTGGLFWQFSAMGPRRIDVFFVLSGFLIAHVTARKMPSLRSFAITRAARVYSVAIPACLATLALDMIGQSVSLAPYLPHTTVGTDVVGRSLLSLTFIGQAWNFNVIPGTNAPWWSLGFEVWFYAAFAAFIFLPKRWRVAGAGGVLCMAGPTVAALFPLFLLGAACNHLAKQRHVSVRVGVALWAGSILAAPVLMFTPPIAAHYVTGALFAVHLVGLHACSGQITLPQWMFPPIRWVAGGTFTLFLLHWPAMEMVVAFSPWAPGSAANQALVLIAVPALCYAMAEVSERRKASWRTGVVAVFDGFDRGIAWTRRRLGLQDPAAPAGARQVQPS